MDLDSTYIQQIVPDYIKQLDSKGTDENGMPTYSANDFNWEDMLNSGMVRFFALAIIIVIIAFLAYRIYKSINYEKEDETDTQLGMGEDTIYGHNWDVEISALMQQQKYSEAVVLCYLRWLDSLNSQHIISFTQSKTPGIFLAEVTTYVTNTPGNDSLLQKTQTLTDNYLYVRYAHYNADYDMAKSMCSL